MAKRLDGVNTKQLRDFMKGVERDDLPTIEEAKARQFVRNQNGLEADLTSVRQEIAWEEALARAAIAKEKIEERFVEPTPREIRERDSREKVWPSRAPTSEKTATSPELHIDDAIKQTTLPKRTPVMPENLRGVSAIIWEAYNIRTWATKGGKDIPKGKEIPQPERDPFEFQRKLSENNIALAVATKDEADRSHRNSEFAKEIGHYSPRFKEGEIAAITEHGNVYKLSQRITGDDERTVARFLKPLDRSQLKGIDETKAVLSERMEQHVAEVQKFRDTLRDVRSTERHERATNINKAKGRTVGAREKAGTKIERIGSTGGMAAIGGLLKGAEKIADGLLNMFDPVLTPAQKLEAKIHEKEREADADQQVDISKYTAERAAQQMQDRERIERGRDRDR